MTVKALIEDVTEFSQDVADVGEMKVAIEQAQRAGKKVIVEQVSCDFTKENFAAKPDLERRRGRTTFRSRSSAITAARRWRWKQRPWGPFMSCPDYLPADSAVQDDPQADAQGADQAAGAAG